MENIKKAQYWENKEDPTILLIVDNVKINNVIVSNAFDSSGSQWSINKSIFLSHYKLVEEHGE